MQAAAKSPSGSRVTLERKERRNLLIRELRVCSRTRNLELGRRWHAEAKEDGSDSSTYVASALIALYGKCASMVDAQLAFDNVKDPDVALWNALILGYAENGEGETALNFYQQMKSEGFVPDSRTFVAALKACTSLVSSSGKSANADCLEQGKQIHLEVGCHCNIYVQNTLIDMYCKCGNMINARQVFDTMKQHDVVSWSALILGYAEDGKGSTALDVYARMKSEGLAPNYITFAAALKACGLLGALESGRKIHTTILETGIEFSQLLVTSLVDFYAKCGSLVEAQNVFDANPTTRCEKAWTALLTGYSQLGDNTAVFALFKGMQDAGFQPDGITFMCILACCRHAGLASEAKELFEAMSTTYGIVPCVEHYTCIVDILGRFNKLDAALALLQDAACLLDAVIWMTILDACRKWKNVEIGRLAFKILITLYTDNGGGYVLLAQIYGSKGMVEEQEMILTKSKIFKAPKEPEESCWTNDMGVVNVFSFLKF